jgi:hypothetical protein
MLSRDAITSQRRRRLDRLPVAFTKHGCLMLANVLRSQRAVPVSVMIVRAFVTLRTLLSASSDLATKIDALDRELAKHRSKLVAHDVAILKLLVEIRALTGFPEPPRRGIGDTADRSEGQTARTSGHPEVNKQRLGRLRVSFGCQLWSIGS